MLDASKVFDDYCDKAPPAHLTIEKAGPAATQGAMSAVVAVAGAVGFIATPSRRIPVNAIGGALSSGLGLLARSRIKKERREAAATAVAARLRAGLASTTPEELASLAESYDVPRAQFQKQLAELYLVYLTACLESPTIETSELSELLQLKSLLRLTAAQIGTQVFAAARALYSRHRAYLEDDEGGSESKAILTKFVFLAERLLSQDESEEGYRYEVTRTQRVFGLMAAEWGARAEEAAVPFYEKTLASAVMQGVAVTAEQLAQVRASLGISDGCAQGLHEAQYARLASSLLGDAADASLSPADAERLGAVRELLGLQADAAERQMGALTSGLYDASVAEALDAVAEAATVDAASALAEASKATLAARASSLLISDEAAAAALRDGAFKRAQPLLAKAATFLRAQNGAQAVDKVNDVLAFCERAAAFVGAPVEELFGSMAAGPLRESEGLALYRLVLLRALDDLEVDAAEAQTLAQLRSLLGMSEAACAKTYEAATGPIYRKAVEEATGEGELTPERRVELQATLAKLNLPAEVSGAVALDVYSARLRSVAGDGKILNEEQAGSLAELRDFLDLDADAVAPVHAEVCSPAYAKSVREVMGTSGIIPTEYWEGLDTLRTRLALSEETATDLFAEAAQEKLVAFGKRAVDAMQEANTAGRASETDPLITTGGGALGMEAGKGSLATEVLNMVDFCLAARVLVPGDADGEERCVATLEGKLSARSLSEVYRQYLIEAFSGTQSAQNARLFNNLERLRLVLGMATDEQARIHDELGSTIYRRYLGRALQQGAIGEREHQFLDSIRDALDMEQERCDTLVREAEVHRVSVMVESMFESISGSALSAAEVRKVRDAADGFEVSLTRDLQLVPQRLEKMFSAEVDDLVTTGELTADDMGALEELCESLEISEERASALVQERVDKALSGGLLQATALLRQESTADMVDELRKMLKFAALSPGASAVQGGLISPAEKR